MKLGVYIHLPFCRDKCDYCSFYSIPIVHLSHDDWQALINRYLTRLLLEIEKRSPEFYGFKVDTIYIGGGTPSLLYPYQIEAILNGIRDNFIMDENGIEITLECNPEDFSIERIHEYKSIGINRIVLGVQTISRDLHSAIGRSSIICDDGLLADYFCFKGIIHCIDMITGIPGQAEEDVTEFFNMCNHGFEHISVYTLGIERGTPLHNRMRIDPTLEDMQRDLFEKTDKILKKRGYIHYEVSNYALPMFESKHNLKYWKFLPYVGFGAGAHSFYKGERFYNPSSISKYLEDDSLPIKDERTNSSKIVEYIFTCMRLREGISMNDFERKLGVRVPKELMNRFRKMEGQDSLEIEESEKDIIIRFSRESFFLMDSLIYEMTEMLL